MESFETFQSVSLSNLIIEDNVVHVPGMNFLCFDFRSNGNKIV